MPVCLKCGWEIVFGPGGCACTRAARIKRDEEHAIQLGKDVAALLEKHPELKQTKLPKALSPHKKKAK